MGMSRGVAEPKLTAMDAMIDKLTGAIFIFQIVVVIVLGIAGNIWKDTEARKVCILFVSLSSCTLHCFFHILMLVLDSKYYFIIYCVFAPFISFC